MRKPAHEPHFSSPSPFSFSSFRSVSFSVNFHFLACSRGIRSVFKLKQKKSSIGLTMYICVVHMLKTAHSHVFENKAPLGHLPSNSVDTSQKKEIKDIFRRNVQVSKHVCITFYCTSVHISMNTSLCVPLYLAI